MRSTKFANEEYYHLYNRGVDCREVFSDFNDYWRFMSLLYLANSSVAIHTQNYKKRKNSELLDIELDNDAKFVHIGAYCLMPNHFHILVRARGEDGVSKFMQKLQTAYSMYFNVKNERTGALFQGKFKAKQADSDEYLKYLFTYIQLNPIKLFDSKWKENGVKDLAGTEKFLNKYQFSSYLDSHNQQRKWSKILDLNRFPNYFSSKRSLESELKFWLQQNNELRII